MDRGYPPLSSSCVKNLVDKLFEKRKLAAAEIERLTKESLANEKHGDIIKLIGYFTQDFITSHNPHTRKGGLLGLASVVIGLNQNAAGYHTSIFPSVLRAFRDNDSRVRYYACETLYNIMKITRKETLHLLSEVFDAISEGVSDPDLSVRQGAMQCDRLLKEIVTEPDFIDYKTIVTLLRERVYTNNPYGRQFIVSWMNTLQAIPGSHIGTYLPQLLDGLFRILGDPNPDIRRQCELLLDVLLKELANCRTEIAFHDMINILIVHCKISATAIAMNDGGVRASSPPESLTFNTSNTTAIIMDASNQSACIMHSASSSSAPNAPIGTSAEQLQQRTALTWIQAFVELDSVHMLPFASKIIDTVLPCFMFYNPTETLRERRIIIETAVRVNETLMHYLCTSELPPHEEATLTTDRREEERSENRSIAHSDSQSFLSCANGKPLIETHAFLDELYRLLDHPALLTRLAAIGWIEGLVKVRSKAILRNVRGLVGILVKRLADPADEVVHSAICLAGSLCNHPDAPGVCEFNDLPIPLELLKLFVLPGQRCTLPPEEQRKSSLSKAHDQINTEDFEVDYRDRFCVNFLLHLVNLFENNTTLLIERGDLIITELCSIMGADRIYLSMSAIISHKQDFSLSFVLVETFNRILLTQPGLQAFRNSLRVIYSKEGCHLLDRLYHAWCHNPVALLSLFMLTQNYPQCNRLIKSLREIDMTLETLIEIDQLIQMIESPIFATLRMHLLDKRYSAVLRETLYCLLMCIPQTDAFQTLWRRLQCVPPVESLSDWPVISSHPHPDFDLINSFIDFDKLFNHFDKVQRSYRMNRMSQSTDQSITAFAKSGQNITSYSNATSEQSGSGRVGSKLQGFPTEGPATSSSATEYLAQRLAKLGIQAQSTPVNSHSITTL